MSLKTKLKKLKKLGNYYVNTKSGRYLFSVTWETPLDRFFELHIDYQNDEPIQDLGITVERIGAIIYTETPTLLIGVEGRNIINELFKDSPYYKNILEGIPQWDIDDLIDESLAENCDK